jgi:hypothetical protein
VIPLLNDLINYVSQQLGLVFGENLFLNYYPDSPDKIVAIMDGHGTLDIYTPTKTKIVEFKIRANTHSEGSSLGEEIINLFHDKENFLLGETKILHSYALSDCSYLYADSKERDEFTFELAFLILK